MAGKCVALDSNFSDTVSSMVIDYGHECSLWASHSCNGDRSGHVAFDQAGNLGGFDGRMNSYSCWRQGEDMT